MAARSLGWQTFPEKSTYDSLKYGVGIGKPDAQPLPWVRL